jgi:sterol desaturase/sphingolipid hydroxylase (fatty acid hydroxylase superfamily)
MTLTQVTVSILLSTTVVGLVVTYAILFLGIPGSLRLQQSSGSAARFHARLPLIALNLTCLIGGTALTLPWVEHLFTMKTPSPLVVALDVLFVFLVDDLYFYGFHRLIHENRFLYRKVHRVHHKAFAPLPLDFIYVHPFELMGGMVGPVLGVAILIGVHGQLSAYSFCAYTLLRQTHELNLHSGIRSLLSRLLPFLGATDHHDFHHRYPTKGNYGSVTSLWDRMFGTVARME